MPLLLAGHPHALSRTNVLHRQEGTHRLVAKQFASGEMYAVVTDHLGTPKEMFDLKGRLVWAVDHHVWGAIRSAHAYGDLALAPAFNRMSAEMQCPWRFPGQYEDEESGLHYNRYRHYDPLIGQYASPDPIGLEGGDKLQSYVSNPVLLTDVLGLRALRIPQGLTPRQMDMISGRIRAKADDMGYGDDIFVQGSRASGKARPDSDLDVAIRVSPDQFDAIVVKRFGSPNTGSALERTRDTAITQGRVHAGEAQLSGLSREISGIIGRPVDISVIRSGGAFDNGAQIPLNYRFDGR